MGYGDSPTPIRYAMTKKEIVRSVSEKLNITQLAAKEVVQNVLDTISETLIEERRIELRNFGIFEVRKRAARKARNPKTGVPVKVKEKHVVTFKSGKALEKAIQKKTKQWRHFAGGQENNASRRL